MINHARTLLLNQPRNRVHYSDYGYEYVPAEFKPVKLTPVLANLRRLLFGSNPDNYFLNFRVNELLTYIHETELADFVYQFDSRVTYWPKIGRPYFEPASKRILITQVYGPPQKLNIAGEFATAASNGSSLNFYSVYLRRAIIDGDATFQLTVQHADETKTVLVPDTYSPPVVGLTNTKLNMRLNPGTTSGTYKNLVTEIDDFIVVETYDPDAPEKLSEEKKTLLNTTPGLEAQWLIETKANPTPAITTLMPSLELLGEPPYLELFGVENIEPYLTFKNLWFDHPLPAYRLSGIVLALIYRTEELRGNNE